MNADVLLRLGTEDGLRELSPHNSVRLPGRSVHALGHHGATGWALADRRTIWQQIRGEEWQVVAELDRVRGHCIFVDEEGPLVGTSEAHLFRLHDGALRRLASFDEAPTRGDWFTPWGGAPAVRSVAVDPRGTLYVNVHVGGILRSTDGGRSWEPTLDLQADVHQVAHHAGSESLLAATARGLGISLDGGASWRFESEGLHGTYLRAVAVAGRTLLVSSSTGARSSRAAVYRKAMGLGEPFVKCANGLPEWFPANIDTDCLVASGSRVLIGTEGGELYESQDGGENWDVLATELPPINCVALRD